MAPNAAWSNEVNDSSDYQDMDTDEKDHSYDEGSDGELLRKEKKFPKFDFTTPVPTFNVGMASKDKQFSGMLFSSVCFHRGR